MEKSDHRILGKKLELFYFDDVSPGTVFWLPKGMLIWRTLESLWRKLHQDYQEVSTPVLAKKTLWEKSGHWQLFKEDMFPVKIDNQDYALKPMNCPASALIYKSKVRSYRDLPLRLLELGILHRNERSGVLGGLFRVRQIVIDDAHIYASDVQILEEIEKVLKLIAKIYKLFDFDFKVFLSTRPEKAMGGKKLWDKAEKDLKKALEKSRQKFSLKPKEGAFYGPKIDVQIKDSLGRAWQLATIQLDFQMPERFKLEYTDEKGEKKRPVIIHRAILGSFERFIGILLEHFEGKLPVWLAPEQVRIIPVSQKVFDYGCQVFEKLKEAGIRVDVDMSNQTLDKKILEAEKMKIPLIAVVGEKEKKRGHIALRRTGKTEFVSIQELLELVCQETPIV